MDLEPGQFVFGRNRWAEALGLSEKVVRNCIKSVLGRGQIKAIKRANKYTIFEVMNWVTYQVEESDKGQQAGQHKGQQKGQQGASKGPQMKNYKNKEEKNKNKNKNKYSSETDEVRLSELLFFLIQERSPKHRIPNIQTWASHIDRLLRLDKRTPVEVEQVIRWSQADTFWQNNILSTEKLRKQFDILWLKMKPVTGPGVPSTGGLTYDDSAETRRDEWADQSRNRWAQSSAEGGGTLPEARQV
ncbi:MAG: hypothetical protein JEY79_14090 [Pseudodesulfovibrio sp.]|nr:hypothetical protein [Pseudodesulfovibrio sp.]